MELPVSTIEPSPGNVVLINPRECDDSISNNQAKNTWERTAVGSQRARAQSGSSEYFEQIRQYRYGYETPWIPRLFEFPQLKGKKVLEIGVGNGIDAVEMVRHGADYTGLDITRNHLELTQQNFQINLPNARPRLIESDLMQFNFPESYDAVYSFGVLHHIAHENRYLKKIRSLLNGSGKLMMAVYSKYSFFNAWMHAQWLSKNRCRNTLNDWRSHVAELSPLGEPVVIKIRSRREVERTLKSAGFQVNRYYKRGFVQNYVPVFGKYLASDGWALNQLGRLLGWYHIFHCRPV
jgi:2-polyprenyl-3-methyl-5-hydroxy-6-metoxy-1,4-benzoquinol methylase